MKEGELIKYSIDPPPFKATLPFKVTIMKPEGPIKWKGFDENGNYGKIWENGCEFWLSAELIADDLEDRDISSPGI